MSAPTPSPSRGSNKGTSENNTISNISKSGRGIFGEDKDYYLSNDLFEINHHSRSPFATNKEDWESSLFSLDFLSKEDRIFVAVGKSESSWDALTWTLKHAISPSTIVYLLHVFPETRTIPSPLGMLPKNQVCPELVEKYMEQEKVKRKELMSRYINACSAFKARAETIIVESNLVVKAIMDIIPTLGITKLVIGTTKSSLRKFKTRRSSGSGIADQILMNAPDTCEVKIVCEGKEVIDQMIEWPTPRVSEYIPSPKASSSPGTWSSPKVLFEPDDENDDPTPCSCFKYKLI